MAKGGFTGATPPRETSPEEYSGVWDITEQYGEQKAGSWPFQADDCAPKSLRFDSSDSAYLSKTPAAAGNRRTWTWSGWIKRTVLGADKFIFSAGSDPANMHYLRFQSNNTLEATEKIGDAVQSSLVTSAVYRDPSAWMHIVYVYDSTQSTAANRLSLYVNGVKVTAFGTSTYPSQNHDSYINSTSNHFINARPNPAAYSDAYLAETHFIDGQALSCEEFGFFDGQGIWQPKRFTGDYSNGPFYSNFLTSTGPGSINSPTATFDGNTGTRSVGSSAGTTVVFTPQNPLTIANKLRVFLYKNSSSDSWGTFTINGSTVDLNALGATHSAWYDFGLTYTQLSSMSWENDNGSNVDVRVAAIEIDGVILTDASVGRNSFHLDFSDGVKDQSGLGNDWTANNLALNPVDRNSEITGTAYSSGGTNRPKTNMFDGNTSTYAAAANNSSLVYTPVNPITGLSKVRIYYQLDGSLTGYGLKVNGVDQTSSLSSGTGTHDVTLSTLNSVEVRTDSSNQWCSISAIEIYEGSSGTILTSGDPATNDIFVDSPVNGNEASTGAGGERRGNYATMNPNDKESSDITLSDGNLAIAQANASGSEWVRATIAVTSGKYYWEVTSTGGGYLEVGIADAYAASSNLKYSSSGVLGYLQSDGSLRGSLGGGASYVANYGATWATNDVIGIALNMDDEEVTFYKNGSSQGTLSRSLANKTITAWLGNGGIGNSSVINFGQRSFSYAAPTGFSPLATSFLPEPTIKRGDEAMDAKLYTGNGTTNTITGLGFSPDLVWIKARNQAHGHNIYDIVRGATLRLNSANTNADQTVSTGLTSFNSDGFTLGADSGPGHNINGDSLVAWAWGGGTSTVSNTDGTITVSQRVNQSAGFSISTYTGNGTAGATWGHGLNAVPDMIIIKARDSVADGSWIVGHSALGLGYGRLLLNSTTNNNGTPGNVVAYDLWNNTAATSSVVSIGSYNAVNDNGDKYSALCWTAVEGYSSFGSYQGNGSSDGPMVYTGFRTAFLLVKRTDSTGAWHIIDSERDPDNVTGQLLEANTSNSEFTTPPRFDFLSNGFKLRGNTASNNASGGTYIYAAFAEHPFASNCRAR